MNKCIKCGRFPFCKEAEENRKECDNFIKRKLGEENGERNVYRDNDTHINNRKYNNGEV